MSEPAEIALVARRFFDAIERGDIATVGAIYAADAVIWNNLNGPATREANLDVLKAFVARAPVRQYKERRLNVFAGGFVQLHVLDGVLKDGRKATLPACVVCAVSGGKITRLDEYFDSAQVNEWLR